MSSPSNPDGLGANNASDEIVTRILDMALVGHALSDRTDIEADLFVDELRSLVTDVFVNNSLASRPLSGAAEGEPDYWAVWSGKTGTHIGLWPKKETAEALAAEYTLAAAYVQPIYASSPQSPDRVAGDGWQPIETAQSVKDGREVLLWLGAPWSKIEKARWYAPWNNWQTGTIPADPAREDELYGIGSAVPTHWRPLPAPPALLNQEEGV